MKKLVMLQLKGNSFGGIWHVNKKIATKLLELGYEVHIISMRNNPGKAVDTYDERLHVHAVNEDELWEFVRKNDVIKEVKKLHLIKAFLLLIKALKEQNILKKDYKRLQKELNELNPDYILVSHYQIIKGIPKKYYPRTIFHQHCSFDATRGHKKTIETLLKYKDCFKFLWLTKETMKEAEETGFLNSYYIYNPVRFNAQKKADVINNKKLVTIARISEEKRIPLMIDIVNQIFSLPEFQDWSFEIYGSGNKKDVDTIVDMMKYPDRMHFMGLTDNPKKVLLGSSIHLNTSAYEGFSLSILEANECGVPTITYNFGESVYEEIYHKKTGMIVEEEAVSAYVEILKRMMQDKELLSNLSNGCKEFSKDFHIDQIIKKWQNLFKEVDGD